MDVANKLAQGYTVTDTVVVQLGIWSMSKLNGKWECRQSLIFQESEDKLVIGNLFSQICEKG